MNIKRNKIVVITLILTIAMTFQNTIIAVPQFGAYLYTCDGSTYVCFISFLGLNIDNFFTLQSSTSVSDVSVEYNENETSATVYYNPTKYKGLSCTENSENTEFTSGDAVPINNNVPTYYLVCAKTIIIPSISPQEKSVTQIGAYALYGDTETNTFVLPNSIEKINHDAFEGCSNLYSIDLSSCSNLNDISENAFGNIGNNFVTIYTGSNAELYTKLTGNTYSTNASSPLKTLYGIATVKASTI